MGLRVQMKKLSLVLLLSCLVTSTAYAAEWSLTPDLSPTLKYDDNVFMSENEEGSFELLMKPTLVGRYALENAETSLSVGYSIERYFSLSDIDEENPFARFNTNYKTERSTWGLSASYVEDSSRNDAEIDTGDFNTHSTISTRSLSPSYSYKLTERDSISVSANYSDRRYSTADFSDNETISLSSSWRHQFSERLSAGLSFTASNYEAEGVTSSTDDDNYNLSTTFDYKLTELWNLNGRVGVRKLNSERTVFGLTESDSSSGASFDVSAKRNRELDSFSIALSRALIPSSTGDVNEQDSINLSYSRELSQYITASISGSYRETTSALDEGSEKRENINFSPAIKWQFEQNLGLKLSYNYRQQKRSDDDIDVKSNAVFVTLLYDWDGIRASR